MGVSVVIVTLVAAVAIAYLFPAPDDDESETNSKNAPPESEGVSDGNHQEAPPRLLPKRMAIFDDTGGTFFNPARILRERKAKKARVQDYRDRMAELEREWYTKPVEERTRIAEDMTKLVDEWVADIGATRAEIDARIAARAAAGKTKATGQIIDTTPLAEQDRVALSRMARDLGLKVRGKDETLRRDIIAETNRKAELRAAAPKGPGLDAVVIGLYGAVAKRLGGWWGRFLRDE